jgi:hypothetical protein
MAGGVVVQCVGGVELLVVFGATSSSIVGSSIVYLYSLYHEVFCELCKTKIRSLFYEISVLLADVLARISVTIRAPLGSEE